MESDTDWTCGCVELSEMQSKILQPPLRMVKEKNKLVSEVKLNDTHLTILSPDS